LQCKIKNKPTDKDKSSNETMEKVDLEQQDNTLDDTIDYNESATVKKPKPIPKSTTITTTTMTSVLTRKDKKKERKELSKNQSTFSTLLQKKIMTLTISKSM
jgi:hypothetical protein